MSGYATIGPDAWASVHMRSMDGGNDVRRNRIHSVAGRAIGASALVIAALAGIVTGSSTAGATSLRTSVAAGYAHSCAELSGVAYCWGANTSGQLGNGSLAPSAVAVPVVGITDVTAVAANYYSSCALLGDGTVECWGSGEYGELGDGSTASSQVPVPVRGLTNAVSLVSAGHDSCALTSTATVECWGYGVYGQLGDGSYSNSDVPVSVTLPPVSSIGMGTWQACAVTTAGTVKCWGYGGYGDLGDGHHTSSATPVTVQGLSNVTGVTGGYGHTCAVTTAGTVACWGSNTYGQLGDGGPAFTGSDVPVAVSGLHDAVSVAAGAWHTCAVTTAGTVECWGDNTAGQLGRGGLSSNVPLPVTGLAGVTQVSGGYYDTCAATASTTVECWGSGGGGELGDGSYTTVRTTPVQVLFGSAATTANPACPVGAKSCDASVSRPGKSLTVTSGSMSATVSGRGEVALGAYKGTPVGKAPLGTTTIFGLSITSNNAFRSLVVKDCKVSAGTTLEWWNGTKWLRVAGTPASTASGCVTVTLGKTSGPPLTTVARLSRMSRAGALVLAAVAKPKAT